MTRYQIGFLKKCAEANVDPRALLTRAAMIKAAEGEDAGKSENKGNGSYGISDFAKDTVNNAKEVYHAGKSLAGDVKGLANSAKDAYKGLSSSAKKGLGVAAGATVAAVAASKLHSYMKKRRQKKASATPADIVNTALYRAIQFRKH